MSLNMIFKKSLVDYKFTVKKPENQFPYAHMNVFELFANTTCNSSRMSGKWFCLIPLGFI